MSRARQVGRVGQSSPSSVLVVGGGVVGLACAHCLGRAGLTVTVLERDRLGSGASRGSAGEICPDLVEPLGAPGVAVTALTGVFHLWAVAREMPISAATCATGRPEQTRSTSSRLP